MQKVKWQKIQF